MDGIIGRLDWDGCDDCQHWNGDTCTTIVDDCDLQVSSEDNSVKCPKWRERPFA